MLFCGLCRPEFRDAGDSLYLPWNVCNLFPYSGFNLPRVDLCHMESRAQPYSLFYVHRVPSFALWFLQMQGVVWGLRSVPPSSSPLPQMLQGPGPSMPLVTAAWLLLAVWL